MTSHSGRWAAQRNASSMIGLYSTTLVGSIPHDAGHDDPRARVVDPGGEFLGREASEDDRVDRPETRAGEHGHGRLGHHRHVHQDPVALAHAAAGQTAGEAGHLIPQLRVGVAPSSAGHR
jgi:hypothetical protein